MMRRRITYVWAFILYAVMALLSAGFATRVFVLISGVNLVPHGTWDYVLGLRTSAVSGAFGVAVAYSLVERRFDTIRFSKVAWSWVAVLVLFCIISAYIALV